MSRPYVDHTNTNGLVDGLIPAGKPCPWALQCRMRMDRCPTKEKLREVDFSCAAARLFSISRTKVDA